MNDKIVYDAFVSRITETSEFKYSCEFSLGDTRLSGCEHWLYNNVKLEEYDFNWWVAALYFLNHEDCIAFKIRFGI